VARTLVGSLDTRVEVLSIWLAASTALSANTSAVSQFVDIAPKAGLTDTFHCGSDEAKRYIIETLGGGVALTDYDNDAHRDIFMVNGHVYPELELKLPDSPYKQRSILYRNVDGKKLEDIKRIGRIGCHGAPLSSRAGRRRFR